MHIPDGMLSTTTVAATGATSVGFVAYAVAWTRKHLPPQRVVLMAVTAALVFALQMLNFPVAGGTSGHFAGGAAAAILLGPWPAIIVMTTVLLVQAVLFADGGILALGANVLNMAVIAPFVAYAIWRLFATPRAGFARKVSGAAVAAWFGALTAALAAGFEIWVSGRAQFGLVMGGMGLWHAIIGIGEGLITAGLIAYVLQVRPDLLDGPEATGERRGSLRGVTLGFSLIALLGVGMSWLASARPDGLEFVYFEQGVGRAFEEKSVLTGPLADYVMPGVSNGALAGVIAGVVGLVVVAALLYAALVVGRRPSGVQAGSRSGHAHGTSGHAHAHGAEAHEHAHHHAASGAEAHEHTHALGFERYTYLLTPVHALDPRFKVVAALVIIFGVVVGPALGALEFAAMAALLLAVTALARIPIGWMLSRSAVVLPIAGGIALFAPLAHVTTFSASGVVEAYATGWPLIWAIVSKAWLSACTVLLVASTTPPPVLFKGLRALRMPAIFLTMLTFLYRYTEVLGDQLRSLRRAVASRGYNVRGWALVRLYGNLAGNLFIRAYERGERVYASMLSRGYDGTLPTTRALSARPADYLLVATSVLVVAALLLY